MSTLQYAAILRDHGIGALLFAPLRIFLDPVNGRFASATQNREDRPVTPKIYGIVAPFTAGDLAAIHPENDRELMPVEAYEFGRAGTRERHDIGRCRR